MQKNILFLTLVLALCTGTLKAGSDSTDYVHRTLIMGVPQHLFDNGVRIEIDKRLSRQQQWLTIAPTIYYRGQKGNWFGDNFNLYGMKGLGAEVFLRHFIHDRPKPDGFYLSVGAGYRYLQLQHRGEIWNEYAENGLTYYEYDSRLWERHAHTFSLKGTLGIQSIIDRHLLIDLFLGMGLKWSEQRVPPDIVVVDNSSDMLSYTFRGFMLVAGIRVGIGW